MTDKSDNCGRIGELGFNKFGTRMKIISYESQNSILVQFLDDHNATVHTSYSNFKNHEVKNPFDRSVFGIGYIGQGPCKTRIGSKHTKEYLVWMSMIQRCYVEKYQEMQPTYYGSCDIDEEWLNFQTFASWYNENKYDIDGRLHLDKDILIEGNRIYGPDTCLLVPQRINMLFTSGKQSGRKLPRGVRQVGEKYIAHYAGKYLGTFDTSEDAAKTQNQERSRQIKIIAEEYKDRIPLKVYTALYVAADRLIK